MPEEQVGFVRMGEVRAAGEAPTLGIGMLGYAFMGKAHTNAYKKIPHIMYPPPAIPRLVTIAGRTESAVAEAAKRFGYEGYATDWRQVVRDDRIQIVDNGLPNDEHAEPSIAAAEAGKHVICEKPLGRNAAEARRMLEAVQKAGVKHACAFNYRFVPAVRLIRDMIDQGTLGRIYHFRASYLQEWIADPAFPWVWRLDKNIAGSGALGDLGAHIIDLARYLVGEPKNVMAMTTTFITERAAPDGQGTRPVTVDDAFEAVVEFQNGALGTLEASRFAPGRKNSNTFEINAERGSVAFNLERLNEIEYYDVSGQPREANGFRTVLVSESFHPYWQYWWPHGHMIGWEHTFVHELTHFMDSIVNDKPVEPHGATFEDGYKNAVICDAILQSAEKGTRVGVSY
jgi:predicted dehydrogenase